MTLAELLATLTQDVMSDAHAEETFRRLCEITLPDLGDDSVVPKLMVASIDPGDFADGKRPTLETTLYALVLDNFNEWKVRAGALRKIGRDIVDKRRFPVFVGFASEAWISSQSVEGPRVMPSEDPNRAEAVVVFMTTFDGRCAQAHTICTRGDDECYSEFGDLQMRWSFGPNKQEDVVASPLLAEFWGGVISKGPPSTWAKD